MFTHNTLHYISLVTMTKVYFYLCDAHIISMIISIRCMTKFAEMRQNVAKLWAKTNWPSVCLVFT